MSRRPGIALDFDGVIADTGRQKVDWLRANISRDLCPGSTDRSTLVPMIGETAYDQMQASVGFESTLSALPVEDAVQGVMRLAGRYEVHILSFRIEEKRLWMVRWLEIHGLFDAVKSVHCGTAAAKVKQAAAIGCQILVDDDVRHFEMAEGYGITPILFAASHTLEGQHRHVAGWRQLLKLLELD